MQAILKHIPIPGLLIGLGVASILYLIAVLIILIFGSGTIATIEDTMPGQIIALEKPMMEKDDVTAKTEPILRKTRKPLLPAPYDGMTEITAEGLVLPIISPKKLTPFKAYQKSFYRNINKPTIGILIAGFGQSDSLSVVALDRLPSDVSLMLSPYGRNIDALQKAARENGFETWMHLPMETKKIAQNDPGPRAILSRRSIAFNQANLHWVMSRAQGYAGIAAFTDETFDDAKTVLQGTLQDIAGRGLGFFEMNGTGPQTTEAFALKQNTPFTKFVGQDFASLKEEARVNGSAAGVFILTPALLDSLDAQIAEARQDGFDIAPVSALAQ